MRINEWQWISIEKSSLSEVVITAPFHGAVARFEYGREWFKKLTIHENNHVSFLIGWVA